MGATLIVDDPELAPLFSGTHLPTSEGWKTELTSQRENIEGSVGMTSTENPTQVACIVVQWFSHYSTATCNGHVS